MIYPPPVAERQLHNEAYMVLGAADDAIRAATPDNPFVLLQGNRVIEEVRMATPEQMGLRVARAGDINGKHKRPFAIFATKTPGGSVQRKPIDVSWLRGASETYQISADPKDFIFVGLPIVTADIPNRNMDCFSTQELTNFSPIHGRFTYSTFIAKACHQNHKNQDPTKAKGVHFDATFRKYDVRPGHLGYDSGAESIPLWKVRVLTGWDRSKDPNLVRSILRRERCAYSMGALVDYATCSLPWCGRVTTPRPCEHVALGKGKVIRGQVVFDIVRGVNFLETSVLDEEPADPDAWERDAIWSVGVEAA